MRFFEGGTIDKTLLIIHSITVKPNLVGGLAARLCHVSVIFSITGLGTILPCCRDIVRHGYNGLLIPPSDPEKLADSIDGILEDGEKLARFGQRGRNMVEQCFSQKQVLSETFAIYNDPNFSDCRQSLVHGGHN